MKLKIAKRVGQLGPVLEVGPSCPRVRVVPDPIYACNTHTARLGIDLRCVECYHLAKAL